MLRSRRSRKARPPTPPSPGSFYAPRYPAWVDTQHVDSQLQETQRFQPALNDLNLDAPVDTSFGRGRAPQQGVQPNNNNNGTFTSDFPEAKNDNKPAISTPSLSLDPSLFRQQDLHIVPSRSDNPPSPPLPPRPDEQLPTPSPVHLESYSPSVPSASPAIEMDLDFGQGTLSGMFPPNMLTPDLRTEGSGDAVS